MPIHRCEIYFVNLNPVQGREPAGDRPVIVLSVDAINRLPLVVAVVVGTKGENVTRDYPTNVRVTVAERDFRWRPYFSVFRSDRWIRNASPPRQLAQSAGQYSSESKRPFDTVSVCRSMRTFRRGYSEEPRQ